MKAKLTNINNTLKDYLSKHQILNCGLEEGYLAAEVFLLYISAPEKLVHAEMNDAESPMSFIDINSLDLTSYSYFYQHAAFYAILSKCVIQGFEFDKFIDVCRETSVMDTYFMNNTFMNDVHTGGIYWHYAINDYQCRFKKFIKFLDEKFDWTSHYLESYDFQGIRKIRNAYWR